MDLDGLRSTEVEAYMLENSNPVWGEAHSGSDGIGDAGSFKYLLAWSKLLYKVASYLELSAAYPDLTPRAMQRDSCREASDTGPYDDHTQRHLDQAVTELFTEMDRQESLTWF